MQLAILSHIVATPIIHRPVSMVDPAQVCSCWHQVAPPAAGAAFTVLDPKAAIGEALCAELVRAQQLTLPSPPDRQMAAIEIRSGRRPESSTASWFDPRVGKNVPKLPEF